MLRNVVQIDAGVHNLCGVFVAVRGYEAARHRSGKGQYADSNLLLDCSFCALGRTQIARVGLPTSAP